MTNNQLKKDVEVITNHYRMQLAIGVAIFIALLASTVERSPLNISFLLLGSLIGSFLLEMDYVIYSYFTYPEKTFSTSLREFINHKDLGNAIRYIKYNQHQVNELILNGILFQITLAGAAIFTAITNANFFVTAIIIAALAVSLYKMAFFYFSGQQQAWFWALKSPPSKYFVAIYGLGIAVILVYSISLL